jgi:IS5 family transposase
MTASTDDFFRSRLDNMTDLRHPLAALASSMPWQEIEVSLAHRFARQRSGSLTFWPDAPSRPNW